jgi:hypothetical protein
MAHMSCIQTTAKPLHAICTACNGSSSAAAAAARLAPAGSAGLNSNSSSSSRAVSGLVRDLLDLLQPEDSLGVTEEELLPVLQQLEQQQLLPSREVLVSVRALLYTCVTSAAANLAVYRVNPQHTVA